MFEILEGAKQGFAVSLCKIYELYRPQIYYFCSKLVADSDIAADLCYETFICAFDELDSLEQPEQFEVWIKNIAAIKCFNYIHKMKPMLFLQSVADTSEPLFSVSEIEAMPKGDIEETKTAAVMDMMINRLNDAQRMTIMLHYFNGLSVTQIAKIMSCDSEIVKQRMEKAAEHMKTTIDALSQKEINLKAVEFRTALQLMVACTPIPEEVDLRVNAAISERAIDEQPEVQPEPTDEEFIIDKYINNAEREVGETESATYKYTENDGSSIAESIFEKFAPRPETDKKENTILATAEVVGKSATRAAKKVGKDAKRKFLSLSMMQQSVALLLVVVVVAAIIISTSFKNKKQNVDISSSSSSAQSVQSTVSEKIEPVYKLEIQKEVAEVKADDGAVVAEASYEYPVVTLSEKPEAQETINSFFSGDKAEVLATFTDENKNYEYKYAYSTKAYGEFKKNERTVTMQKGRVDGNSVNFLKTEYNYLYGNVYGNSEVVAYSFSSVTGKQLEIGEVMADLAGYKEYAYNFICSALQTKQNDGELALYSEYTSAVSKAIETQGNWYFTDTGLTVVINPDEVAFYTYGPQAFEMPYSELENYLAEQFAK